jgi:predicted acetyltransferase
MLVTIREAKNQEQPVIKNLMQLYLHDFSEFADVEIQDDASYDYPYLKHYWQDPDRFPFLIRLDGNLAGFALVRKEVTPDTGQPLTSLAEFFVLRRLRRLGIGRRAATKLWDLLPGSWVIEVLESNKEAYPFWKQVISAYTREEFEEIQNHTDFRRWTRFTFTNEQSD